MARLRIWACAASAFINPQFPTRVSIMDKARSEVQAVNLDKIHGVRITCSSFAPTAAKAPAPILTKVPMASRNCDLTNVINNSNSNNHTTADGWSKHVMNQNENLQRTREMMFEATWTNMASQNSLNKKRAASATCNVQFQNWLPSEVFSWCPACFSLSKRLALNWQTRVHGHPKCRL